MFLAFFLFFILLFTWDKQIEKVKNYLKWLGIQGFVYYFFKKCCNFQKKYWYNIIIKILETL
jgi:hypothetical protein